MESTGIWLLPQVLEFMQDCPLPDIDRLHVLMALIAESGGDSESEPLPVVPEYMYDFPKEYKDAYLPKTLHVLQSFPDMLESRLDIAEVEFSDVVSMLYTMLCKAWDQSAGYKAVGAHVQQCLVVVNELMREITAEAEQIARLEKESADLQDPEVYALHDEFLDRDLHPWYDRHHVLQHMRRLALVYLKALQCVMTFKEAVWVRENAHKLEPWVAEKMFKAGDGLTEMLARVMTKAYLCSYMGTEHTPCDADEDSIMSHGDPELHRLQQAEIVRQGLKFRIRGENLAFVLSDNMTTHYTVEKDMTTVHTNFCDETGGPETCYVYDATSRLTEFIRNSGPVVSVKMTAFEKEFDGTANVTPGPGSRLTIRCIVNTKLAVILKVEPASSGFVEVKAGFLYYEGGRSILRPKLTRYPSQELVHMLAKDPKVLRGVMRLTQYDYEKKV